MEVLTLSLSWYGVFIGNSSVKKSADMAQPNLTPPITTVKAALEYKSQLLALEPKVNYLMSLYVCHFEL